MKRRRFLAMLAGIPALAGAYALTRDPAPLHGAGSGRIASRHPAYVSPAERARWKRAMHGYNYGTCPTRYVEVDWHAMERRVMAYAQDGRRWYVAPRT